MIFGNFSALVKKDLLMFFRSKISSVIIILIPLIIILAAGYAFSSSQLSSVYVGVHFNSSSTLSQNIASGFSQNGFIIKNYSSSSDCINSVELDESQICAIFSNSSSGNFTRDSVVFYADYSRLNLAGTLINNAENSVYNQSVKEGEASVQDLISLIDLTKSVLPSARISLNSASSDLSQSQSSLIGLNIPVSDFDTAISYLNTAYSLANSSNEKSYINNTIALLSSMKSNNENVSIVLGNVASFQGGVSGDLASALRNINAILTKVQSKNISSAQNIVSPIGISVRPLNQNSSTIDYMTPVLLALIALFGAILLSSAFVLKEKKTKAYFRNFMTPSKDPVFIISTYVTCLIILLIQFILVFAGVYLILHVNLFAVPLELAAVLFASLTAFIFVGMFIGYVFRSEESVIFASMIAAGVFLFFSNTLFPIENISSTFMSLSIFNPLIALDSAFKKVILFGLGFSSITSELTTFGIFFVVFAILTYLARKITRRML